MFSSKTKFRGPFSFQRCSNQLFPKFMILFPQFGFLMLSPKMAQACTAPKYLKMSHQASTSTSTPCSGLRIWTCSCSSAFRFASAWRRCCFCRRSSSSARKHGATAGGEETVVESVMFVARSWRYCPRC